MLLSVHFWFWGIFGLFWVFGSLLVNFGSGGDFGSIFGLRFTFGSFWLMGSLLVRLGLGSFFGSILGSGVT